MKILLALVLAACALTACDDPHKDEHCTAYLTQTHVHTDSKHHTHVTTSRSCTHWEKNS